MKYEMDNNSTAGERVFRIIIIGLYPGKCI